MLSSKGWSHKIFTHQKAEAAGQPRGRNPRGVNPPPRNPSSLSQQIRVTSNNSPPLGEGQGCGDKHVWVRNNRKDPPEAQPHAKHKVMRLELKPVVIQATRATPEPKYSPTHTRLTPPPS